jgi:predicted Zn-dependent protease
MKNSKKKYLFIFSFALIAVSCSVFKKVKSEGVNIFTIAQDKEFGAQVASEIDANPAEYPILDSARYKEVYAYVYKVRNNILNSGKVTHKNDFNWRIRIINDDKTLNAFCTPGGYIYVYTGILKYLDSEDQFAGVLGHEIGHADMRHSTRQMTKLYGVQVLLDAIAGDRETIKTLTTNIVGLKFSREHETEADQRSVEYLCPTPYNAAGGAGFFQKIQDSGSGNTIEFLSTHPNPVNRIEHFHKAKTDLGCGGTNTYTNEYKQMLANLNKVPAPAAVGIEFNGKR